MQLEKPFAIIGCAHSGTLHTARIFQQLGLDVTHDNEKIGRDGIVSWAFAHYLKKDLFRPVSPEEGNRYFLPSDSIILHQVRDPLKVIASICATLDSRMWEDIGNRANYRGIKWNPLDDDMPLRGMKYWLLWNTFSEQLASYCYRIEAFPEAFPEILSRLSLPESPLPEQAINTNYHNLVVSYSWAELYEADSYLAGWIRMLAEKYGYDVPSGEVGKPEVRSIIKYFLNNSQNALVVEAKEDLSISDSQFFLAEGAKIMLDGKQLSRGFKQWGRKGIKVRLPLSQWEKEDKIDLSIVDMRIAQSGGNIQWFLQNHRGNEELIGAEIGVFRGENALKYFKYLNIKKLYLVDPYEYNTAFQPKNFELFKEARELAYQRLQPYKDRIVWIYKRSDEAIDIIGDELDFAFLDSAHTRKIVAAELPIYYQIVKGNGVLAGDDYANRFFNTDDRTIEVRSTVDEFVIENNISPFYYSYQDLQWFIVKDGVYHRGELT